MIDVVRTIPSGLSFSPRKRSGRSFSWSRIAITELSIARGSFSFSLSLSLFPRELPPIIMGRSAAGDSGEIAIEMSTVEVPSLSPPCIHRVNKCWGQFFFFWSASMWRNDRDSFVRLPSMLSLSELTLNIVLSFHYALLSGVRFVCVWTRVWQTESRESLYVDVYFVRV